MKLMIPKFRFHGNLDQDVKHPLLRLETDKKHEKKSFFFFSSRTVTDLEILNPRYKKNLKLLFLSTTRPQNYPTYIYSHRCGEWKTY